MSSAAPTAERGNGAAVAGFVCGLLGLITSVIPLFILVFPGILDILGIVFGMKGRTAAAGGARQGGLATAGFIMGIIGLLIWLLWWLLFAIGVREQSPAWRSRRVARRGRAARRGFHQGLTRRGRQAYNRDLNQVSG